MSFGTFGNPIINGVGTLIRAAIRSVNYVAGISGWTINADGSYEFGSGGTIRGDVTVTNPSGSNVKIFTTGVNSEIDLQPPDSATPGVTFGPATISATSNADIPLLEIIGAIPVTPVAGGAGQLNLGADPVLNQTAGYLLAQQIVLGDLSAGSTTEILSPDTSITGNVIVGQNVQINGIVQAGLLTGSTVGDLGRGIWAYVGSTTNSATASIEQVVLTVPSTTYIAGRLYRMDISGKIQNTNGQPFLRTRKTNLAGAIVFLNGRVGCNGNGEFMAPGPFYFRVDGSNVTAALAFTLDGGGVNATHTAGTAGRAISIWDVGPSSAMPDIVQLT
jgi:hypothetical protein